MAFDSNFAKVVLRASQEPGFRGKLVWFPEKVAEEYDLNEAEASAARTGDFTELGLDEDVRELANQVFDLHDLHAGE